MRPALSSRAGLEVKRAATMAALAYSKRLVADRHLRMVLMWNRSRCRMNSKNLKMD